MTFHQNRLSFVAVPIIADNPRYGWHIQGTVKYSSEKKANEAIQLISCKCKCHKKWNADLCDECQHRHGLPRFEYE